MPPAPRSESIRYGPRLVPGESDIPSGLAPATGFPRAPRRRRRFLRQPVDRMLGELLHRFGHCAFELGIVAGDDVLGPVLHVDIGWGAHVLDRPVAISSEESAARRDHR